MLDLSVIIVSYNTRNILHDCLKSLYKNTPLKFEVIIVDNASTDGSIEMIKKNFPKVRLIVNKENKGFGGGNNQGSKIAKSDYLLLLNSDTVIKDDAIAKTLNYAKSQKNLGAISCQLLNKDGSIQPSGGYFPNLANLITWQFGLDDLPIVGSIIQNLIKPVHPKLSFYTGPKKMDWVTGAFTIIPTKIYKQVGGFDEKIFMYAEELELCYRIKKRGYEVRYYPKFSITHLGGKSGGTKLALQSEIKGIKYFFTKHRQAWQLPLVNLVFLIGSSLRYLAFGIILRNEKGQIYKQAI